MKRVTISFKFDKTVALATESKGKITKVVKEVKIDNSKYYKDEGTLNYTELINQVKHELGKEYKDCNVYVVMPDYLTSINYVDSLDYTGKKEKELPDNANKTLKNKRLSYIGESNRRSISQIIYFNQKNIKDFTKELYKAKLNAVELLSHYTALHNSIVALNNTAISHEETKTRIVVDLGLWKTGLILFNNNLPIYIKNSDYNLMSCYKRLKTVYENMELGEFIQALNEISLEDEIEQEKIYINESDEDKREREIKEYNQFGFSDDIYDEDQADTKNTDSDSEDSLVETGFVREVKLEVLDMLKMLGTEIKETYDLATEKYSGYNIEIIGSSHLVRKFITKNLSSFNINNHKLVVSINTDRSELDLSYEKELNIDSLLCIGSVIESLKKGADYYE